MKSHKKQILRLLENHGDSLSTKQIRGALGLNKAATAKLKAELLKLTKAGGVSKEGTRYFKAEQKPKHAVSKEKKGEAKEEADKIVQAAHAAIEAQKAGAVAEMKSEMAILSISIAEKIIRKELSNDEQQKSLANALVADLKLN